MLALQKTDDVAVISVPTSDKPLEDLLSREWLLTNHCGGYASSTIVGCNTRRYHGLLIGSVNPLANRIMALANSLEMVITDGKVFNLSTFEFSEKFTPDGFKYVKRFRRDIGVHLDYQLDKLELTKSIYLLRDTDTIGLVYDFTSLERPAALVVRPFIGLRDFHTLQKSYAPLSSALLADGIMIRHDVPGSCELFLTSPSMDFARDPQWWFNFVYRNDKRRGQDFTEDLWSPGFFKCRVDAPVRIVLWANLSKHCDTEQVIKTDIDLVRKNLSRHQNIVIAAAKTRDEKLRSLCLAADQYIAKRRTEQNYRTTILAGFPWFADWGRDTFIALPGLLLATGRFDEAKSVLATFAQAADQGMIPNRFDDYSDTAYFNSIDASLWFIHAAFQYLHATGDSTAFMQQFMPVIRWIVDSYQNGTRFGIHADTDGLITGGNQQTQLTWMDAKYGGVAFTPRYGKAVEVNALWYNCLCYLAGFYPSRNAEIAARYQYMSEKVAASFSKLFWNQAADYLNDCILPDGSVDAALRPNQIFAVSLPYSPLTIQQQKSIIQTVQRELLTPYGLRTLNVADARYKGKYAGPQRQRDEAYHQGTVWPFLIGPFVEAYLKVNDFTRKSKKHAAQFIKPLMQHLTEDGCIGQVCEIFDGDDPGEPKGCIAQAWSVGELIRAYQLLNA